MKRILLLTIMVFVSAIANAKGAEYKITIQNLTKGQPITPAVAVAHKPGFKIFSLGEKVSDGLAAQAKDGMTDLLVTELNSQKRVSSLATGDGVVLPGQTTSLTLTADSKSLLSLTAMLARTNDALVAGRNFRLPRRKGVSVSYALRVYDAGAEANTESCEHIPAPPCGNPGQGPAGEGFLHSHPGVYGIQDLEVLRDSFGRIAAKVTITKM